MRLILFDDKNENKEVELWKGVTFQKVENPGEGITWTDYCRGIDTWRRYQAIRIPLPQYSPSSRRYFVGYVGTDVPNAERYKNGCRRLPTDRSARWGYGLYASDNPYISFLVIERLTDSSALFFSSAKRDDVEKKNLHIVKLYARDKNAFMNMQKVGISSHCSVGQHDPNIIATLQCWVPERGKFHRIDSEHLSFEETCNKNDRLDLKVWKELGFHKPYLLFTRHHQMEDMYFLKKLERFNELVIYPQAQDAMFYGEVYTIEEAEAKVKSGEWKHREWNHHMKAWGIKMHPETKEEFFLTEKEKKEGEVKEWKLLEDPRDFY
ncbi:hypothetical protein RRF57_005735 [Xylaria bambusicola]|uniref:Uncharacterized protein n=1 Tax=Xylaria bambusicola TaxID=326684 RepID=A0AAN7YY16_9PEZI